MNENDKWGWLWKLIVGSVLSGLFLLFMNFINNTNISLKEVRDQSLKDTEDIKKRIDISNTELTSIKEKISSIEEKYNSVKEKATTTEKDLKEINLVKEKISVLEKVCETINQERADIKKTLDDIKEKLIKLSPK